MNDDRNSVESPASIETANRYFLAGKAERNADRKRYQLKKALNKYEQTLYHAPNNVVALSRRADILFLLGQRENAVGCLQKALEISPNHPESRILLAKNLINQGDQHFAALQSYQLALAGGGDADLIYLLRGQLFASPELAKYDEAIASLELTAAADSPLAVEACCQLAFAAQLRGDYVRASSAFRKTQKLLNKADNPEHIQLAARCHLGYGLLFIDMKRYNDALSEFEQILNIDQNHTQALYLSALCSRRQNEQTVAKDFFQMAYRSNISGAANLYAAKSCAGLGKIALADGDYSDAIDFFSKALTMFPQEDAETFYYRHLAYIGKNDKKAAVDDLKKSRRINPMGAVIDEYFLAVRLLNCGEHRTAIPYLEKVAEYAPKQSTIYRNLARALLLDQIDLPALKFLKKSRMLTPDWPDVHIEFGHYYFMKNVYSKAAGSFKKAYLLNEQYRNRLTPYLRNIFDYRVGAQGLYHYGIALIMLKKYNKAAEFLTKLLRRDPFHSGAYYFRGYANKLRGEKEKGREDFSSAVELIPAYGRRNYDSARFSVNNPWTNIVG